MTPGTGSARIVRGRLVWCEAEPRLVGPQAVRDIPDGALLLSGGRIVAVGEAHAVLGACPPGTEVDDYRPWLVAPGLIDAHIHFPQTRVVASYGSQLLEWLQRYTFPEELRFADPAHGRAVAPFFIDELLRNGTTTAAVYCSVHPASVDALFEVAQQRRMRLVAGKVMMDRGAPEGLLDTAEQGFRESQALIERWHGTGRLSYAVSPRFAITSTQAQLEAAAALLATRAGMLLQTHLAENEAEVATARRLFPEAASYTDVYARAGLLGPGTLLGHCIHLDAAERQSLGESGAVAVWCPTSNLFIGSGLFDLAAMWASNPPVRIALATDIGGGTSYSMLATAGAAYQVAQLRGLSWHPLDAFWQITLGNAQALGLADRIGKLSAGHEADLVVLDPSATPAMDHRLEDKNGPLSDLLFLLQTMGDDRAVRATYIAGERVAFQSPPMKRKRRKAR